MPSTPEVRETADNAKMYKDIHRIKAKITISASLLIGAAFVAIFIGAFKVNLGMEDTSYDCYEHFHMIVPERNGEPRQVVAYTTRTITQYNDYSPQGATTLASVVRIDVPTGKLGWNFTWDPTTAPGQLMNVGYVERLNEWYGVGSEGPKLLVQFAAVEATETTVVTVNSLGGTERKVFRNETGSYRTYTWDLGAPAFAGSTTEITAAIGTGSRAIGIIRLPYNATDDYADYIVVSTNRTWEKPNNLVAGEGVLFEMHAMHSNGSLAWSNDSNTSGSILDFGSTMLWGDIHGFALNSSHFAIQLPDNHVAVGSIATGIATWDVGSVEQLIENPCDHSGDGWPDLVCINSSKNLICIDGTNGSVIPGFPAIPLGTDAHVESLRVDSRFGDSYDLFLVYKSDTDRVRLYQHDATGVTMRWEKGIDGYGVINFEELWMNYYDYVGPAVLLLHLGSGSSDDDLYRYYDIETGAVIADVIKGRQRSIAGDFFAQWQGLEILSVNTDRGYLVTVASGGTKRMFELDSVNLIVLLVAVVVAVVAGLALVRVRRTQARLSRKKEEMQPVLVANERSITTTRNTTRPLRTLSMVMLLVVVAAAVMFIAYIVVIGTGDVYYGGPNYNAVRNGYVTIGLTLVSLPIIAVLYNNASPRSAMLHIKIQRFFYKVLFRGRKEHRILVLDMSDYAKKFSTSMIIGRSVFPLLVSLTLGLTVFSAFASDTSGIGGTTGSINLPWIAEFELYAGLTFVASYLLMALISPGGWLLDDSGVVYFEQPVETHHPGDISKISDWLTGWLKGFFGFTALLNYYNLFAGTNFIKLVDPGDILSAILLIVFVFGIMIVASPILYGLIAMFSSNASMIDDLEYNRERLYDAMRKAGIDVTPRRLKDFFEKV